jgi:hypothetical protein
MLALLPAALPTEVDEDPEDEPELQMQLVWAHTATYPDEPPSIRLRSVKGLGDNDLQEATDELQRHIQVIRGGRGRGGRDSMCSKPQGCCREQRPSCGSTHWWEVANELRQRAQQAKSSCN